MAKSDYRDWGVNVENNLSRQGLLLARRAISTFDPKGTDDDAFSILGQQQDLEVNMTPVQSEADTAGRQKTIAFDVEVTATVQQTTDTELAATENLTDQLIDVVVAPSRQRAENLEGMNVNVGDGSGDTDPAYTDALQTAEVNGLSVFDVLASVEPSLDFMGEGSAFDLSVAYRIPVEEIA
jgi:hypothetical protein